MTDTAGTLHARAYKVTVGWTLLLLLLGSVVHATESSLACPDWPTCFGTMLPEMSGGVFWEHLHRLVAGGLVLMFGLATWLARREARNRTGIFRLSLVGMGLLIVQSLFGGLTVLYRLPDLVSTTHLALAFGFLALATLLATLTAEPDGREPLVEPRLRRWAVVIAGLVFVQSVLGALVRHMDAGMACPDVPLCLGRLVPPLVNAPIAAHFFHRVLALVVVAAVIAFTLRVYRSPTPDRIRRWAAVGAGMVVVQAGLGVASVLTVLSVAPVSLHTVVAAALLGVFVHLAGAGYRTAEASVERAAVAAV